MKRTTHRPDRPNRKIVIYSTCTDDWGGSEELWARSISLFKKEGTEIFLVKNSINRAHPEFMALSADPAVRLMETRPGYRQRLRTRISRSLFPKRSVTGHDPYVPENLFSANFRGMLKRIGPDLVLISQSINFDGLLYGWQCLKLHIPYVLISHKAVDFYWPDHREREYMTRVWKKALRCFFVSQHNLKLTEEQFGFHFFNGEVILNPVRIAPAPVSYPATGAGYRLACVGRLFLLDKGQDMLLRVLAKDKWKVRPLTVTFIGSGPDLAGLTALAKYLGVTQVRFAGFQDGSAIWKDYHGLVLPSRSEGMPLVITEAMAAGRIAVVTRAGGNAELVEEGVTGFVSAIDENALDEAMERAWSLRDQWCRMGMEASGTIGRRIQMPPEKIFVNHINALMYAKG